jgi:iron complex outermembrane receptor protein
MAPGMDVASINSNTWAISCRGFNFSFANKLLVLIDGRTVYNPDFAGVYWDMQDVVLEDVERIEIIRGPGGTLWGANAMNGVINIITKKAKDTQGIYAQAGGSTYEQNMETFRYGGKIGEGWNYRVYGKHFDRGQFYDPWNYIDDSWGQSRFGFRADWESGGDNQDTFTIQGDHYTGNNGIGMVPTNPTLGMHLTGENVLMRWRRVIDDDSDWSLQAYYDYAMRSNSMIVHADKTLDIEFQYRFPLGDRHSITCGAGFRNIVSYIPGGDQFGAYMPTPYFTTNYSNEFVQDEIELVEEKLTFTVGCKLEQNPYTGLEYQPTARLRWTPDRKHTIWAAISRAVRTPSRAEEMGIFTAGPVFDDTYLRDFGNRSLISEAALCYELGYRAQVTDKFSWDIAGFYNVYDHLITPQIGIPPEPLPPPPPWIIPYVYNNVPSADTCGVELATNYTVSKTWRLYCQYTVFSLEAFRDYDHFYENLDPRNQVYLRSSWDLRDNLHFDLMARYVDRLESLQVPSYISIDARLGWQARKNLELAVVGQNLLDSHHQEYNGFVLTPTTYPVRGVYGTLTWRY